MPASLSDLPMVKNLAEWLCQDLTKGFNHQTLDNNPQEGKKYFRSSTFYLVPLHYLGKLGYLPSGTQKCLPESWRPTVYPTQDICPSPVTPGQQALGSRAQNLQKTEPGSWPSCENREKFLSQASFYSIPRPWSYLIPECSECCSPFLPLLQG